MASAEQCMAAMRKAVGKNLSLSDLEAVAELLEQRAKAKREAGMDASAAELRAAAELAEDVKHAAAIERRNAKINIVVRERFRRHAAGFARDPSRALSSYNVGANVRRAGARDSVDARQRAWLKKFMGGMLYDLNKASRTYTRILGRGLLDREIAREMWEIGREAGTPGVTGNKAAREIADILHKYQEAARIAQNDRGADIRSMPGYIVRQAHNEVKIRRMGYEGWRDFILPKLDAEATFKGSDAEDVLRAAFDNIISGSHLAHRSDDIDAAMKGFVGVANRAKRVSARRVLHFKSSDDFMDYNDALGRGRLMDGVVHGLETASRDIGLFETWGTTPKAMFESERKRLIDEAHGNPDALRKLRSRQHDYQFQELTQETRIPDNATLAMVGSSVRAIQSMAKLGGAVISSMADMAMVAAETRQRGGSLLKGYGTALSSLLRGRGSQEQRAIADLIGVGMDGLLGNIAARFTGNDDIPGTLAKMNQMFFRLNQLAWWTDAQKTGVGLMIANDLARLQKTAFDKLDPNLRATLESYGIDTHTWRLVQTFETRGADGRDYLDPSGARALDDQTIKRWLVESGRVKPRKARSVIAHMRGREFEAPDKTMGRITAAQVRKARDDVETQLRAFMTDRAETAVPTPGARERAILTQGTQAGTPLGEAVRFMSQFKQFPVTVMTRPLGEAIYARGGVMGVVHLIVASTVLGYLAMAAKDLAKGRVPRDPTEDPAVWLAALTQGGGLGIFGDFMFGEYNRFGGGLLDTAAGPTIATIGDIHDIYVKMRNGDDAGAKAFRTLQSNTPFLNLWYSRLAVDYLVAWHVQEAINPGAMRRMERRVRRDRGQEHWVSPGAAVR